MTRSFHFFLAQINHQGLSDRSLHSRLFIKRPAIEPMTPRAIVHKFVKARFLKSKEHSFFQFAYFHLTSDDGGERDAYDAGDDTTAYDAGDDTTANDADGSSSYDLCNAERNKSAAKFLYLGKE